jgi:3-hydroxymyristoyl/3-hydroxydecanoyl-(acyl carrier protein) dehydratase
MKPSQQNAADVVALAVEPTRQFARAVPMDLRGRVVAASDSAVSIDLSLDPAAQVFRGHYPHFAILPGVYLIETALQAIEAFTGARGWGAVRMTSLKSARLLSPVRPGDQLRCNARLLDAAFSPSASAWEVTCSVGETVAAKLHMTVRAR